MLGLGWKVVAWVLCGIVAVALIVAGVWRYGITAFAFAMYHYQVFLAVGAIVATLGTVVALCQLWFNTQLAGVKFVSDTLNEIVADKEILKIFNAAEQDGIAITALDHSTVTALNRLLSRFAIIAYAREKKIINDDALAIILYDLLRVLNNDAVKEHVKYRLGVMKNEFPKLRKHPYELLLKLLDRFSSNGIEQGAEQGN